MELSSRRGFAAAILILSGIAILLTVASASARGDVILDNIDPANAQFNTIYGPLHWTNGETAAAVSFSVSSDSKLDAISIIAKYVSGGSRSFNLAIYGDAAGLPSSSLIARRTLDISASGVFETYTANFAGETLLTAGSTYWAVVSTAGAGSDLSFALQKGKISGYNSSGKQIPSLPTSRLGMYGNMKSAADPTLPYWMHMSSWNPGIRVEGSPVPEPSGLLSVFVGLVSMVGILRRGRRAGGS